MWEESKEEECEEWGPSLAPATSPILPLILDLEPHPYPSSGCGHIQSQA